MLKLFTLLVVLGVVSASCSSQPVRTERLAYQAFDPVLKPHAARPYNSVLYSTSLRTLEKLGPLATADQASIAPDLKPDSFLLLVIPQPPVRCNPDKVVGVTRKGGTVKIMLTSGSVGISPFHTACPPTPVSLVALRKQSLPAGGFTLQVTDRAGAAGWIEYSQIISTTQSCFEGKPATECQAGTSDYVSGSNY